MPLLQIFTNISKDKVSAEFLKKATTVLAQTLSKPESYCTVHVLPDQHMSFGGTTSPCAHLVLKSIGQLGGSLNKKHSQALSTLIKKELGIESDRMYIHFVNVAGSDMGYAGDTF